MSRLRTQLDRAAGPALAVLLTLLASAHALRLWHWRPGTPFGMRGDEIFIHAEIKTTLETGWFWSNDSLGAPFQLSAYLFPETSVLQLALVRTLGFVITDPFSLGFTYFVLGFPLAALAFYALARSEGVNRSASVATGVLFAMAPGHQLQYGHLWLASLWIVPLLIWLALKVARGRLWDSSRPVVALALVVVALSNIYYAAFAMILMALLAVLRRLGGGRPADLLGGLGAVALIGLTAAVPLLVARHSARQQVLTGPAPAFRVPAESERYAGKLMDLVLPWDEHRVGVARMVSQAYNSLPSATVETAALGLAGLVGVTFLAFVGMRGLAHPERRLTSHRESAWALIAVIAFLFYTVGGLGSFVGLFVTPQLRTWSRWHIVILAVGLLAVAALLQRVSVRNRRVGIALAAAVLVVGVLDQTNPAAAPDYAAERERLAGLRAYTAELRAGAGGDCAILQLPVTRFPEAPRRERTRAYDQLMPYVAGGATGLSWSFGAMSGTPAADWQLALDPASAPDLVADAQALDFCAIEVDTAAYVTSSTESFAPVSPVPGLLEQTGPALSSTPDGRFVAFRVPQATNDRRSEVLSPVLVSVNGQPGQRSDASYGNVVGPRSRIAVANLGQDTVSPIRISFSIEPFGAASRTVTLSQDGVPLLQRVAASGEATRLELSVPAPPGRSFVEIVVDGALAYSLAEGRSASAIIRELDAVAPTDVRVVSIQTPRGP